MRRAHDGGAPGRASASVRGGSPLAQAGGAWPLAKAYLPRVPKFRYAAAVAVAAAGGGVVTRGSALGWYRGLRRPSWTPPSRAFGPVWTVLYAPYLAWSTYAATLNLEIWRRNRSR